MYSCGNGLISAYFQQQLKELSEKYDSKQYENLSHYVLDINNDALALTERIIKNYNLKCITINTDLFSNYPKENKLDLILFNPVLY